MTRPRISYEARKAMVLTAISASGTTNGGIVAITGWPYATVAAVTRRMAKEGLLTYDGASWSYYVLQAPAPAPAPTPAPAPAGAPASLEAYYAASDAAAALPADPAPAAVAPAPAKAKVHRRWEVQTTETGWNVVARHPDDPAQTLDEDGGYRYKADALAAARRYNAMSPDELVSEAGFSRADAEWVPDSPAPVPSPAPAPIDAIPGLSYLESFLSSADQQILLAELQKLDYQHQHKMGHEIRRGYAQYGYTYGTSGRTISPAPPFPGWLQALADRVAAWSGAAFNQCIVTQYPAQYLKIGWHCDAPVFGGCICGVSLGASARLQFRRSTREKKKNPVACEILVEPGSIYCMSGAARWEYEHHIPDGSASIPRYSLTFRTVTDAPAPEPESESVIVPSPTPAPAPAFVTVLTPLSPVPESKPWPAPIGKAALTGYVGDFLELIEPESEADPHAVLFDVLIYLAAVIGNQPHCMTASDRQTVAEFCVIAGKSARSRKGTVRGRSAELMGLVAPDFLRANTSNGIATGEGLIDRLSGRDTRLLSYEGEFAKVLWMMRRYPVLSADLRDFYDGKSVGRELRSGSYRCDNPHLCISGDTTQAELSEVMVDVSLMNGFANRVLWVCVQQRFDVDLLHGGKALAEMDQTKLAKITKGLQAAIAHAQTVGRVQWDKKADAIYAPIYHELRHQELPVIADAITSRAETHVTRLALLYALLDMSKVISAPHINAALAAWKYCRDSALYLFPEKTSTKITPESKIITLLEQHPEGLTTAQVTFMALGNNQPATPYLHNLEVAGQVTEVKTTGIGRPTVKWKLRTK